MAMAAISTVPTQSNGHALLQVLHITPPGCNLSNYLVAGHQRVLRDAPLIVDHAQVTVAYTAVENVDLHFIGLKFADFIAEGFKLSASFFYGICIYCL
jgi:hypothetical protein